jgi:hypothetical protein
MRESFCLPRPFIKTPLVLYLLAPDDEIPAHLPANVFNAQCPAIASILNRAGEFQTIPFLLKSNGLSPFNGCGTHAVYASAIAAVMRRHSTVRPVRLDPITSLPGLFNSLSLMPSQELLEFNRSQRAAKIITLNLIAPVLTQKRQLLRSFHAFGNGSKAEVSG